MDAITEYKNLKNSIETVNKVFKYLPEHNVKIKTIPSIFSKTYDENFISAFLAYVLDPSLNGIGAEPLKKITENFGPECNDIIDSLALSEQSNFRITREYCFSDGKRIDILINIKELFIIAIENKIFANESDNQTVSYTKSIRKEFPNHEYLFLFLTPDGKKAQSKEFKTISYEQLIIQLKKVEFDYRKDIRKKIIFDDFILHVEEHMMDKKSSTISEQTKLYLEYEYTISKLRESFEKDSLMVFKEFEGAIKDLYSDEEWVCNIKSDRHYQQIYKDTWKRDDINIHYEFWISSENIFSKLNIELMVDVEGKEKDRFFSLFNEEYQKLESQYKEKGILYRPDDRKIAIAYRETDNYFKPNYVGENRFILEFKNFEFLEIVIDELLMKF